ncbi:MAG: M20 family metallopeptidase [Chloroflexota bacterium]
MYDFEAKKPEMVSLLKTLVELESPSNQKALVDRVGAFLAVECQRRGAQVEMVPNEITGDHLIARWGSGSGGILLLHHMDTVFPAGTLERMPFYEKEERIFGPGVLDMKGGIVISLSAISALQQTGELNRPVTVLVTSDEEIGSDTSHDLIRHLASEASLVLVMESGLLDGSLKTWRKGVGDFLIKVKGRAAHAGGAHEEGRNAIEELAHQVLAIQKMTDYAKGTTLNVGVIQGGTVSNVVPEEASAIVDFRVLIPSEAERVSQAMQALQPVTPDTSLEVTGGLNRPPMPNDALMKATFEKAGRIAAGIGMQIKAGGSGGGSDGNFVAPLGIPLLDGMGTYGEGLHSEREYIFGRSLPERAALTAALIKNW